MVDAKANRNLLFGILALQMDFISQEQLVGAMHAWVVNKAKSLGELLLEAKAFTSDTRALLEAVVDKHLELHSNDPKKSLSVISTRNSVCPELKQIADLDVQASLSHASSRCHAEIEPFPTLTLPAGSPSASGQRFRILRPHARGGLGEVFLAYDEEVHREVALKEIQIGHSHDAESRARFLLEAEITGRLEHPGIVPVYGLGYYADERPFYAMRFIKGQSLKEAIEDYHKADTPGNDTKERKLVFRKLLGQFVAVCNAIAYAHSRGVLHRDLKPNNIMLGPYGETLVVDWGLAKVMGKAEFTSIASEGILKPFLASDSAMTQAGSMLGTPGFMSPEQAAGQGDRMGFASDIYSLGATLYCLLTGQAPFTDQDIGLVLQKVQRGRFPHPREIKRGIPLALESICLKAMALQPEMRYATVGEMADEVERWLADEPYSAYRDVVFTLTTEGAFSSLSSAFETLTGWSRADWLGKAFAPLVHPEDLAGTMDRFQRALQGESPPVHEVRIQTKSGDYMRFDYMIVLQIQDGKTTGLLGIAREMGESRAIADSKKSL